MEWFRFYSTVLDDPKVQRLPAELFKIWVNLLCLANQGDVRGQLPAREDIAFRLRLAEAETDAALDALIARGLLDEVDGALAPHNWSGRQPKSDNVTERVQRHRAKRYASETTTAGETLPQRFSNALDTDTEREAETETEGERRVARRARPPAPADSPHGLCVVFLEALGRRAEDVAPAWFDENRAHAKRLLEQGFGPEKLRAFVAYEQARGKRQIRLRYVVEDILDWEAAGCPARPGARDGPASPEQIRNPLTRAFLTTPFGDDDADRRGDLPHAHGLPGGVPALPTRHGSGDQRARPRLPPPPERPG